MKSISKEEYYGMIEHEVCCSACNYDEAVYAVDLYLNHQYGEVDVEYDAVMAAELQEWADNPEEGDIGPDLGLVSVSAPPWAPGRQFD
jgi:hypothetical protein